MALEGGSSSGEIGGGRGWEGGFRTLMRRKQVDSGRVRAEGHHQLAKELNVPELVAIGVGSTIGAGVYVLVGTVAREHAGPALTISFLIAGIAAALSAFCYAELASRCPSAGSAYHYSYICVGEGVAWLIGWALVLEYTIGGSAVARGISPNLALFFGGPDSLPWILARHQLPWFDVIVDPCAAALVFLVTVLLCTGIKESSSVQGLVTVLNACVMLFVIVAGSYIGFQIGWVGYKVTDGYLPYGVNGMLAGSATVFFAYIGFDTVASTAEEVKNPQRDLPLGIGAALSICCLLYMMVSVVIVGLVPYFAMDPDTPISSAFAKHGMQWAMYVVTSGAVLALCSTLMGSLLPQPRILMAMARDGLLPSFFSDVNKRTQVPVKSTIVTGISAAALAFFMDVSQLAGMVSVGTLLAFTIVAVSILILRYVPPDEVPLPSSLRESFCLSQECDEEKARDSLGDERYNTSQIKDVIVVESVKDPLIEKKKYTGKMGEMKRRKMAAFSIGSVCVGVLVLTSSASATWLPFLPICIGCIVGGVLLLSGLVMLFWIDQDFCLMECWSFWLLGVHNVTVDGAQQKVTVTGTVDADTLIRRLYKSGKQAVLWHPPTAAAEKPEAAVAAPEALPAPPAGGGGKDDDAADKKPEQEAGSEKKPEAEKETELVKAEKEEAKPSDEAKKDGSESEAPAKEAAAVTAKETGNDEDEANKKKKKPKDAGEAEPAAAAVERSLSPAPKHAHEEYYPYYAQQPMLSYHMAQPSASVSYYAPRPEQAYSVQQPPPQPAYSVQQPQQAYSVQQPQPAYSVQQPQHQPMQQWSPSYLYMPYPQAAPESYYHDYYSPPETHSSPPLQDSYRIFDDENPNSCSVM